MAVSDLTIFQLFNRQSRQKKTKKHRNDIVKSQLPICILLPRQGIHIPSTELRLEVWEVFEKFEKCL